MTSRNEEKDERVTIAQFAAIRGVTVQAVRKAIKDCRISGYTGSDGVVRLNKNEALRQWEENTNQANDRSVPQDDDEDGEDQAEAKKAVNYHQSRAIRERYSAKTAKLEYRKLAGSLVSAVKVKTEAFECARITRDAILNVPNRLAPELAGESDPVKVHIMLTKALTEALESLADAGDRADNI